VKQNDYEIDGHKLDRHPKRVADWMEGKNIYPIYMEISPSGACNHRCIFCALDFMEYRKRFLDESLLRDRLLEMARLGVRAIQYAGEGEPLLHGDFADIVRHTSNAGIDVGVSTNGVLLDASLAGKLLPHCTWIKVSVDAGKKETYAKIHGCRENDFNKMMSNMSNAAEIRDGNKCRCVLGFQAIVLPENISEIHLLAAEAYGIGMDYIVLKPYSQHPLSKSERYHDLGIHLSKIDKIHLYNLNGEHFKVIVRENAFRRVVEERKYDRCLAMPFWSYVDAGGGVWGCSCFLGDESFYYGNIRENTFEEIWEGELRRGHLRMMRDFDVSQCRINCRMDRINEYLWNLKHPGRHVNFI